MGKYLFACMLFLLMLPPPGSYATSYDNLVVYGDSLSDTGNVGRFTDGDVWVELLADSMDVELFNYAHAWAPTGHGYNPMAANWGINFTAETDIGLLWQVGNEAFVVPGGNSLFAVWAGANDLMMGLDPFVAAENIATALGLLYDDGARDFLVGNLPDLGVTPFVQQLAQLGEADLDAVSFWTGLFNMHLDTVLDGFKEEHTEASLYMLDAYSLFAGCNDVDCAQLGLFWEGDYLHPSSLGHQLIAQQAAAAVAPVPEPSTVLLLGSGLVGLFWYGRKRNAK